LSKPVVFHKVSKEEWLQKVAKDLKGAPLSSLDWTADRLSLTPFYTEEDRTLRGPMQQSDSNTWKVGEVIHVHDEKETNQHCLHALQMGANSLYLTDLTAQTDLYKVLADIQLEWIHTHLDTDELSIAAKFAQLVNERGFDPNNVRCSMAFTTYSTEVAVLKDQLPHCQQYAIASTATTAQEQISELLLKGEQILQLLSTAKVSISEANRSLRFRLQLSDDYYLNIAKIRAIKLCWQQILRSYDDECTALPIVEAHIKHSSADNDENHNTIRSTSQALSAVIAGIDTLYVHPSKAGRADRHALRINRNISHLLSEESHLHLVGDPAAGSYFFEAMTDKLAQESWSLFQDKFDPQS